MEKKLISVIITGASTGIGAACAISLAKQGHQVFAGVRKPEDGKALQASEGSILPLILDVTKPEQVSAAKEAVAKQRKADRPFCVINNAGIAVGGPLECILEADMALQMDINVLGVHRMVRAFAPWVRASQGRFVNMSSISGRVASPFLGPYAASKFALEALSDSLRRELLPLGCRVVLIEPGPVKTPIWAKGMAAAHAEQKRMLSESGEAYRSQLERLESRLEKYSEAGVETKEVVEAVEKALFSPNPKERYLVGRPAKVSACLAKILPTRWLDDLLVKRFKV